MPQAIAAVTLLAPSYDEAIAFYVGKLGFELVEDTPLSPHKRWVLVAPPGGGARLLLAQPADEGQRACVGAQAGGRVFLFLHTDDFARDHALFASRGVEFLEPPRREAYGTVAVFRDPFGNRWDLVQPSRPGGPSQAGPLPSRAACR